MDRLPFAYLLIFHCFTFICICGRGQGIQSGEAENSDTSTSPPKLEVVGHLAFNLGNDVDLNCSDKTWNETLYVIWTIELKHKTCRISFNSDGRSEDFCQDGKSLQNTSSAQSYLHIPNFSNDDVGVYKCESVFKGGSKNYEINVAITVVRHLAFNLGNDVDLECSDKTWNETLYVIWTIELKHKTCRISFNSDGRSEDFCEDGKSLQNTSSAQSYLHIPNFSNDDVGVYKCESVFKGGSKNYEINVAIIVPPSIYSWLERKDNKMVAVCKAERGKPAANISWSHMGNSSTLETEPDSYGFFTVESRIEFAIGMDTENLRCFIRHPYWNQEQILAPKLQKGYVPWLRIFIVLSVLMLLTGFVLLSQKKTMLRRSQQSDTT